MGDPVVDDLLVLASVRLGDTFRDNAFITLLVACIATILALIADSVEQEVATEGAQHELVELSLDELVAVHLMDITLALSDGSLTAKAS